MRVLLAAASFHAAISGLQRHALNVARCLIQQPEISALDIVVAPWQESLLQNNGLDSSPRLQVHIARHMTQSSLSRNFWYYRHLPVLAKRCKADLVHLTYPMPLRSRAFRVPTIVTLHDLYPWEIPANFGFPKSVFNRLTLRQCLRNADTIACVSDATRERLREYAGRLVWQKSVRIYNCVEAGPIPAEQPPIPGWRGEPLLLCVAQHRQNKNLSLLIRAFELVLRSGETDPRTRLVIVGIGGPETNRIRRLVADRGLRNRVHFLEGLSESGLQWCYARCEALLSTSTTEGFGLSVAEGLLAGCRIVCSDIPAHREIGRGSARYVALSEDAEERFASAVLETLRKPKNAPKQLPEFSSATIGGQYIRLYRRLLASAPAAETAGRSAIHATPPEREALEQGGAGLLPRAKRT